MSIDAGNSLVERIKPHVKSTQRPGADTNIGGFGGIFDIARLGYKDPLLVAATDGVGTKLNIARIVGNHTTIGVDLVAMCVNDLVVQGAEPLFFLDYFATGKLNVQQAEEVIAGIAEGCRQAGCGLIGGETAEMPGMYKAGEYDLAGFSVGAVERDKLLPRGDIKPGDILIGLRSSGVHSNGYSLVRFLIDKRGLSYSDVPAGFSKSIGEVLLEPTRIYVKTCLEVIATGGVKALCHITGGGLTENLPRVFGNHVAAELDLAAWSLPPVFRWLQQLGEITAPEMLRTFNCGIGMVLVVDALQVDKVLAAVSARGEEPVMLGQMVARKDGESGVAYTHAEAFGG